MTSEILVLALGTALLFVHITLQIMLATKELGPGWNAGPRDGKEAPKGLYACRAARALENFKETFPALVGLALALVVTGRAGGSGAMGAWLWLGARVVYLPLYLFGVPYVRSLAWAVSCAGLVWMLVDLVG